MCCNRSQEGKWASSYMANGTRVSDAVRGGKKVPPTVQEILDAHQTARRDVGIRTGERRTITTKTKRKTIRPVNKRDGDICQRMRGFGLIRDGTVPRVPRVPNPALRGQCLCTLLNVVSSLLTVTICCPSRHPFARCLGCYLVFCVPLFLFFSSVCLSSFRQSCLPGHRPILDGFVLSLLKP